MTKSPVLGTPDDLERWLDRSGFDVYTTDRPDADEYPLVAVAEWVRDTDGRDRTHFVWVSRREFTDDGVVRQDGHLTIIKWTDDSYAIRVTGPQWAGWLSKSAVLDGPDVRYWMVNVPWSAMTFSTRQAADAVFDRMVATGRWEEQVGVEA